MFGKRELGERNKSDRSLNCNESIFEVLSMKLYSITINDFSFLKIKRNIDITEYAKYKNSKSKIYIYTDDGNNQLKELETLLGPAISFKVISNNKITAPKNTKKRNCYIVHKMIILFLYWYQIIII